MNSVTDGGFMPDQMSERTRHARQVADFRPLRKNGASGEFVVAVSGLNATDNPGPGTGVARSLREASGLNVRVIGLAYDAMEPGIFMNWLYRRCYLMPYPSAEPEILIERLLQIKRGYGLDCVIPNFDVELPVYIRCAEELARLGIHTFLPTREQFQLRNKQHLPSAAQKFGIRTPETRSINSFAELAGAVADLGYPLMIKGPYYKAFQCNAWDEVTRHFHELVSEWGYPIIAQRVICGSELNLVGVGDGKGSHFGLVTVKKISTTNQGKIWTGVTVAHQKMTLATERFLQAFQWRGPFELECMVDAAGEIYLIEINPRFPAWTYCATGVGINLPARLVQAALGQKIAAPAVAPSGKLFIRYTYEIVTDATPMQAMVANGEYHGGEHGKFVGLPQHAQAN
jgi:carbamoyl-phosphate synthase large subunit